MGKSNELQRVIAERDEARHACELESARGHSLKESAAAAYADADARIKSLHDEYRTALSRADSATRDAQTRCHTLEDRIRDMEAQWLAEVASMRSALHDSSRTTTDAITAAKTDADNAKKVCIVHSINLEAWLSSMQANDELRKMHSEQVNRMTAEHNEQVPHWSILSMLMFDRWIHCVYRPLSLSKASRPS